LLLFVEEKTVHFVIVRKRDFNLVLRVVLLKIPVCGLRTRILISDTLII